MEISLIRKRPSLGFLLALVLSLLNCKFFPGVRVAFFAPPLIIAYYHFSFERCLWYSLLCGLFIDLLSSHQHLGLHALTYSLTTALLFRQQRNFFADKLSTLPLMTFLFSFSSTWILAFLIGSFENRALISLPWIGIDTLLLSVIDAVYAFFCFIFPAVYMKKRRVI